MDLHLLALGLEADLVGFAAAGTDVEEGEDGGDDDADCDDDDEDDEAVGAAGGVVVGAGRVAFEEEEGCHVVCMYCMCGVLGVL